MQKSQSVGTCPLSLSLRRLCLWFFRRSGLRVCFGLVFRVVVAWFRLGTTKKGVHPIFFLLFFFRLVLFRLCIKKRSVFHKLNFLCWLSILAAYCASRSQPFPWWVCRLMLMILFLLMHGLQTLTINQNHKALET